MKHKPTFSEAEYSYQREVPILPLLLQPGYKADGWLGAMVGTKLYVNLSTPEYEQKFPEVLKEVYQRASASTITATQAPAPMSGIFSILFLLLFSFCPFWNYSFFTI